MRQKVRLLLHPSLPTHTQDVGSSDDEYYEFNEAREGGEREGGFRQFRSGEEEDVDFSDDDDEVCAIMGGEGAGKHACAQHAADPALGVLP